MEKADLEHELAEAQEMIRSLQEELAETNCGLIALTLELEQRVEERTAALNAAHAELERTNSELLHLTLELEDRVEQRTRELEAKSEEVRAMTQQLWQAAKMATVGELAASVAHELNNPLAIITLRLGSLLRRAQDDVRSRRSLEIIHKEVDRMARLVSSLLQFSHRSLRQVSSLNIAEEIESALGLVHYHLRKHAIEVVRRFAPDLPLVQADRQQLRQVFLNLLTNACDAMPHGGTLMIEIATGQLTAGTPAVVTKVIDTGTGIAPEILLLVFEPFFTTKAEGKGTGLGLAICKRIVEEHGGSIELASELGRWTTASITLPVLSCSTTAE